MNEDGPSNITLQTLTQWQQRLNSLYQSNISLRMKYPSQPLKFYQPQQEMDQILTDLLLASQQHIPILIQSKILLPILKILNHPNSDINCRCIEFLHELISEQPADDSIYEKYYRMNIWLIENGIFESLVETISKMDEENSVEEYEVALQILKIIETLLELWDNAVEFLVNDTKIVDYLANRIMPNYLVNHKVIDDNKFVSSDVLVLILSHSLKAQEKFHAVFGMEILLESIRPYLSKAPASNDQQEYLSNLFDCVSVLLINPSKTLQKSREMFHSMKGNEIMLQFIRAKNTYSVPALKCIANSFTSADPQAETKIIEELIDFGGLKYVFPIILRQGLKGEDFEEQKSIDESVLQIVYIMVRSTSEIYKLRVESKLTEKRFAKLQKLFELRSEYLQNVGKDSSEQLQSNDYLDRLKDGLAAVQTIDKIVCSLVLCTSTVKEKLISLMKLYGVKCKDLEITLRNIYSFIGEVPEKHRVQRLMGEYVPVLYELSEKKEE